MTTGSGRPLLSVQDLSVFFPTEERGVVVHAVEKVSFLVHPGETFGIIGESGSGKSTIARTLVGLQKPTHGQVIHDGADLTNLSARDLRIQRRGYQIIFQDPDSALDPRMSVLDSVREPLDIAGDISRAEANERAKDALQRVGLRPEVAARRPHELSGGQKQRATIARALTVRPKLLVCDEVVSALDVSIQAEVLNLLLNLQQEFGLTYVFITHNLSVVAHVADRIAVMYLGRIVELASASALAEGPLHPYTEALLSAEPLPLPASYVTTQRIVLHGEIPSPMSPPSGCRFRTRCPHAQAICSEKEPELDETRPGHWAACHFAGEVTRQSSRPAENGHIHTPVG
jgi:peptide/nickel transport system ATP-binding protein/oligopeptide transport system ATP-binding protein